MTFPLLQPWFANLLKRQVKAPKLFLRDTGLLHQLLPHPRLGASWEGFVIKQLRRRHWAWALRQPEARARSKE